MYQKLHEAHLHKLQEEAEAKLRKETEHWKMSNWSRQMANDVGRDNFLKRDHSKIYKEIMTSKEQKSKEKIEKERESEEI